MEKELENKPTTQYVVQMNVLLSWQDLDFCTYDTLAEANRFIERVKQKGGVRAYDRYAKTMRVIRRIEVPVLTITEED